MNVPQSWIVISWIFFLLGSVGFLSLTVLVFKLIQVIKELQPRVERLTERVDSMAEKLEKAAASAQATVETVGTGTRSIVNSLGGSIVGSAQKLEKLSTVLVTVMTLVRIYRELSSLKNKPSVDKEDDEAA